MLSTTKVTPVTVPPEVITQSAERALLIGGTLTPATLDLTAK